MNGTSFGPTGAGVVDLGTSLIQFLDTALGKATVLGSVFGIFLKKKRIKLII